MIQDLPSGTVTENWSEDLTTCVMTNNSGNIFRIKKYAIHDGPGIRTTVFFKGCSLDCAWCHNPEGKSPEPQAMAPLPGSTQRCETVGRNMTAAEVVAEIEKDLIFYDESGGGATFSGGEPLMQAEFLETLLASCRSRDIHTAVDTSGHAGADRFRRMADLADLVLFDLKIMDDRAHRIHTGISNGRILENLKWLAASGTPHRIRFPLVPGITEGEDNIRDMAQFVMAAGAERHIDILPFHRTAEGKYRRLGMENAAENLRPPRPEIIATAKQHFEDLGFKVTVGG